MDLATNSAEQQPATTAEQQPSANATPATGALSDFDAITQAENDAARAQQAAEDSKRKTFDFVKNAIVKNDATKAENRDKAIKIANPERLNAIVESRRPRTTEPTTETIKRLIGETNPTHGDIAFLVVGLPPQANYDALIEHIEAFAPDTTALGANMCSFGINPQNVNHHTDEMFKQFVDKAQEFANMKAGQVTNLLSSEQPFSNVYNSALRSVMNRE